jgi:RNA-binding protein 39
VFAYNLSTKADEREIFQFFSKVGTVNDVRIIYDRNTPTSKGMAYVEFADEKFVEPALGCTGQILRNQVVMVKASEAEKNAAWKMEKAQKKKTSAEENENPAESHGGLTPGTVPGTTETNVGTVDGRIAATAEPVTHIPLPPPLPAGNANASLTLGVRLPPPPPRSRELLVENVHSEVGEDDLRAVFEPFGETDGVTVHAPSAPNATSLSATVRYKNPQHAASAASQLNGLELVGKPMRLSVVSGASPGIAGFAGFAHQSLPPPPPKDLISDSAHGIKMDARSRAALMAKLAGTDASDGAALGIDPRSGLPATAEQMASARIAALEAAAEASRAAAESTQGVLGPASPIPTECVLLKNMFRPEEETEDEWWLDIARDVEEECAQFGVVKHAFVDRDSEGFVYVKFASKNDAERAKTALHGRWFAGRTVRAEYQFTAVYDRHFET